MRFDFPVGGEVAFEALWEGRWCEVGSRAGNCVNVANSLLLCFILQASIGLI